MSHPISGRHHVEPAATGSQDVGGGAPALTIVTTSFSPLRGPAIRVDRVFFPPAGVAGTTANRYRHLRHHVGDGK